MNVKQRLERRGRKRANDERALRRAAIRKYREEVRRFAAKVDEYARMINEMAKGAI